jgi:RNA polymerase sigma factor (sigma-70 family)
MNMDETTEISFENLVSDYENMIWKISRQLKEKTGTEFELQELYNFGLFGLWKAYEGYKPERGTKFSTYAYSTINGHILNAINDDKKTYLSRSAVKKKEEVINLLWIKEENGWSWKEIQQYSNLTPEEWSEAIEWTKKPLSIHRPIEKWGPYASGSLMEYIPGELGIEEKIISKETIKEVFSGLDELEQEILRFRFLEGYNKTEVGEILHIPSTTYSRKEKNLIKKIKEKKACS